MIPTLREDLLAAKKQFEAQLAETDRSLEQHWQEWDNAAIDRFARQRQGEAANGYSAGSPPLHPQPCARRKPDT